MRFADYLRRQEIEKARDDLAELDLAKSRFTANIHHELRTPLTLTLAPVEAMLSGEFGDVNRVQRSYLETVRANGLRLLKLINNLLDLAKVEGHQLAIHRRSLRLQDLIEEIVAGAQPMAERKGVALSTNGLEMLPAIHADPEALDKLLVNLLGNALKFTGEGGAIVLSGEPTEEGGLHLVVSDTGVGIPSEQLSRIFDRFAQVDMSTTRKFEGTGIGLALVKELVDLHGGRIWAESEGAGHGAHLHVVFPQGESDVDEDDAVAEALVDDGTVRPAVRSELTGLAGELEFGESDDGEFGDALRTVELHRNVERNTGQMTRGARPGYPAHGPEVPEVLVVEDNLEMRRLLYHLVGQEFRVRVASDGRAGLEAARACPPDLVLSDVMMPELSGTELCAAIKTDPELVGVPVVLITSKAEREMKIAGLERGADDYVTKPFHPRELLARVRSLVKLRRVQQELAERNALLESTNEELSEALDELKRTGAQLVHAERLAAVGELAAGVAHEINNPVNFAVNAARALRRAVEDVRVVAERLAAITPDDPEALREQIQELEALRDSLGFDRSAATLGELIGIVTEGLERTARLVGDMRDFASPAGRAQGEVDVVRGLQTTLRLAGHTLAATGVELHTDLPEGLPRLSGDARALNQVFLNLVKNAAEAFEERGGSIWVSARVDEGSVMVEIRDDGPGLDPEVRERLFEPFVTTKQDRGTGLGLSISRRIVVDHGGELELEPSPEGGTRARMRLPLPPVAVEEGPDAS